MTKVISYLRVSTKNQDLQNQKYEILDYCHKSNLQIDEFIEIEGNGMNLFDRYVLDGWVKQNTGTMSRYLNLMIF